MTTSHPPLVSIRIPADPVPGVLEKIDSTSMPILAKQEKSDQGPRPLYQNLEDPKMPMRRSVHKQRTGRHSAQIRLQLHRVTDDPKEKDSTELDLAHEVPTVANMAASERPKESALNTSNKSGLSQFPSMRQSGTHLDRPEGNN